MSHLLPPKALEAHIAVLGKTGSGKTYAAKGLVETLINDGRRVCVIDPTGAWWGLKSSASGKSAGLPVTIFGGPSGRSDMPIQAAHGGTLGEVIATSPGASIVDLSEMGVNEQHRFVAAFAEAIYHHNRMPLHLVIDEADEFAPQKPMPESTRMLGNVQRIAARGRVKGFRLLMISQRPARLNKDVLTQAATLVAMQLTAPQDRNAVEDWIAGQASPKESRNLIDGLPRLKRGEAVVWAPDFGVLAHTFVPQITTYDSSATPDDADSAASSVVLAKVDMDRLRGRLAEVEAETKSNDPKALKAEVARLNAELARVNKTAASPEQIEAYRAEGRQAGDEKVRLMLDRCLSIIRWAQGRRDHFVKGMRDLADEFESHKTGLDLAAKEMEEIAAGLQRRSPIPSPTQKLQQRSVAHSTSKPRPPASRVANVGDGMTLGKGERACLIAIAQGGVGGATREQVGLLTGYKRSTRDAYIQRLSVRKLVVTLHGGVSMAEGLA